MLVACPVVGIGEPMGLPEGGAGEEFCQFVKKLFLSTE
jgi:hypothetical protein